MSRRAVFMVTVAGTNITAPLLPVLISITVSDRVGTHADTATLDIDDTDGRIILPSIGAPAVIALGWEGGGVRVVFTGTVDEVRSSGSRGGGRTLSISAKGVDTTKKPKEPQQRHFDDKTVEDILAEAGRTAGIIEVEVDPALASIKRTYFEMRDESFIHMGERLAREIGGNFRVQGTKATMSKRGGIYTAAVAAVSGQNLHAWDIAPVLGRAQYGKVRARWYDPADAVWKETEEATSLDVDARHDHRYGRANGREADDQAAADKGTSERDAGEGSVTIEGDTAAIPDGLCIVVGASARRSSPPPGSFCEVVYWPNLEEQPSSDSPLLNADRIPIPSSTAAEDAADYLAVRHLACQGLNARSLFGPLREAERRL